MTTGTTFVRVSTGEQIEKVEALAREIWTEHYQEIIGREQVDYMLGRFQTKEAITEQIKAGCLYFLIGTDNGFMGYLAVLPKGRALFLSKIYVRRSSRKKGYGREAICFVERLARQKGLEKISLTVNKHNTGSIRVYKKLGFRNVGSVVQDIGEGFVMDDYRMEKSISRRAVDGQCPEDGRNSNGP